MTQLTVSTNGVLVGFISEAGRDLFSFHYDGTWLARADAFALSRSLPLAPDLDQVAATEFFSNLLPEGGMRERICQQLKISVDNDLALLAAIGGECAGALVISDDRTQPRADYRKLTDADLHAAMASSSVFASLTAKVGLRLSLAGAQDKLPVMIDERGHYHLPIGAAPSTHILKFASRSFANLPANETLMLLLARALGLRTVDARFRRLGKAQLCEVTRYDRVKDDRGVIQRLHQEDMCQALARSPKNKYEKEGGPSFLECVEVVRAVAASPLEDTKQLLLWQMFNLLAGNSDGHAKNVALIRSGVPTLAPFYDLVCTRAYDGLDPSLAMSVGGLFSPDRLGRAAWEAEAKKLQVKAGYVVQLLQTMADALLDAASDAAKGFKREFGASVALEAVQMRLKKNQRMVRAALR